MANIATGLTQHTVVIVVDKRERGLGMQSLLQRAGYRTLLALSLYDALQFVSQEMPHLVVCESTLSDGSVAALYDRLQHHQLLSLTPIIALVMKKTREEVEMVRQRQFAGFLLGGNNFDTKAFLVKVTEVVRTKSLVSPYLIDAVKLGDHTKFAMSMEATVVGQNSGQVLVKSAMEIDPSANLLCVPQDQSYPPAIFKMASNRPVEDGYCNSFPLERVVGKGRLWLEKLPEADMNGSAEAEEEEARVLYYDPNPKRFEEFAEVFKGYDIDLQHAPNIQRAVSYLKQKASSFQCVYLHELSTTGADIQWKELYSQMSVGDRPPSIIGTSACALKSNDPDVQYIQKPFGLGVFLDMIRSASANSAMSRSSVELGSSGVLANYMAQCSLLALDETGGILEVRLPLLENSRICLESPLLKGLWGGENSVRIVSVKKLEGKADTWQVRFEAIAPGMSKTKYWEKIVKGLEGVLVEPEPETTEEESAEDLDMQSA
ncbi:MAG: hypothetical protein AB8C84_10965 [Oligoflexales bacterium]